MSIVELKEEGRDAIPGQQLLPSPEHSARAADRSLVRLAAPDSAGHRGEKHYPAPRQDHGIVHQRPAGPHERGEESTNAGRPFYRLSGEPGDSHSIASRPDQEG